MTFDITWQDNPPNHYNLFGMNNMGAPISQISLQIAGRAFWYPLTLEDGASHGFWGRLATTQPQPEQFYVTWVNNEDGLAYQQDWDGTVGLVPPPPPDDPDSEVDNGVVTPRTRRKPRT
jgi:hypothetical protein